LLGDWEDRRFSVLLQFGGVWIRLLSMATFGEQTFTLFHYWRSSSSWRVRWVLAYKNIPCEFVAINLLENQQTSPEHLARNPMGYVPTLAINEPGKPTRYIAESTAIIEYLEELYPTPSVLPGDAEQRALIRQLCQIINADTQPIQNLCVGKAHSSDVEERNRWNRMWIKKGLKAYETIVQSTAGTFSIGDELTAADMFLIPQLYNATRFDIPLSDYPILERINTAALATKSGQEAHPDMFKP
jgi:maleylacetoacetate isomerase